MQRVCLSLSANEWGILTLWHRVKIPRSFALSPRLVCLAVRRVTSTEITSSTWNRSVSLTGMYYEQSRTRVGFSSIQAIQVHQIRTGGVGLHELKSAHGQSPCQASCQCTRTTMMLSA